METTIVPIVKNKCGNLSNSNNYRPIAIATITFKVLESLILKALLITVKNFFIPLITNLDLSPVIVLNFAFTLYKNILNFTKDEIQQFL